MRALTNLFKKLEESMTKATLAEAGEFEVSRRLLKANKNAHKRVLLGTDRQEIEPKTISYVLNLCRRLGGGLEVFHMLHLSQNETDSRMDRREELLASLNAPLQEKGVVYHPMHGLGCLADELLRYADGRGDILCVVFDAADPDGMICHKAKENMIGRFETLHCPVVIYAESIRN